MIEKTQVNVRDERTIAYAISAVPVGSFFRRCQRDSQHTEGLRDVYVKTQQRCGDGNGYLCVNLTDGYTCCLLSIEMVIPAPAVHIDLTVPREDDI